jgi:hypothetical protein
MLKQPPEGLPLRTAAPVRLGPGGVFILDARVILAPPAPDA